ncbi:DevC protein (plasmid) [Stanieria sp. NIES-3757]|nr:DevC protein [Stanieria sp. NIES-3757]
MIGKLPTAWLQLTYQKMKFFVAIAGIALIVALVFMQLGFQSALFDSSVRLPKSLQGDIFLISSRSTTLTSLFNFSQRRLYQAFAFSEVDYVVPIYTDTVRWRNPDLKSLWRNIYLIGFDPNYSVFDLPGVKENIAKLKIPDLILFDRRSRPEFGDVVTQFDRQSTLIADIRGNSSSDRQVTVAGLFSLGTSFGIDGNLITSDLNFLRIVSNRQTGLINLGLIKLKPNSDLQQVIAKMKTYLPADIQIFSQEELIKWERSFWQQKTVIGFIFNLGLVGTFVVGIIIIYQILYSNISDYLVEFATLKAIGYRHIYLLKIVFQQSFILAILGYVPGFFLAQGVYYFSRNNTNLPIYLNLSNSAIVLLLTTSITLLSGAITVHKLKGTNPADIF